MPDGNVLAPVLGAIIVAVVAFESARRRQKVELEHDREMRDLADLRVLLDSCTTKLTKALNELFWARATVGGAAPDLDTGADAISREQVVETMESLGLTPPAEPVESSQDEKQMDRVTEFMESHSTAQDSILDLVHDFTRLTIRLGPEHPVTQLFIAVRGDLGAISERLRLPLTQESLDEADELIPQARTHLHRFLFAVVEEVGSKTPS